MSTSFFSRGIPPVIQLTGTELVPHQTHHRVGEIADPSPPHVQADGKLRIYGSGSYCLEFDGWDQFTGGTPARRMPLALHHPCGRRIDGNQRAWDINVHGWDDGEVLYAGVMVPTGRRRLAKWPHDNWTRRVYPFVRDKWKRWVRQPRPVFGEPAREGWVGHSYGHHFLEVEDGSTWIFYEKVSREARTNDDRCIPYLTEIFARKMISPLRAADEETLILGVGDPPLPGTHRRDYYTNTPSGFLVEGPRPVRVTMPGKTFFMFGFSSGDFPTDHYGINLAWSERALGPYRPLLEENGESVDLADLGRDLRRHLRLSWGPARPSFFQDPHGRWWSLFHAVKKDILPDRDYTKWPKESLSHFFRSLYLAPLDVGFDEESQSPRLRLSLVG